MKTRYFLIGIAFTTGLFFTSCEKDEDTQKPLITDLEVGHTDTIYVGEGIHLEFYISDNDVFDYYRIKIHAKKEEGHEHKSSIEYVHWDFDSTFTEINGKRGKADEPFLVHHHRIMVPENAELGAYYFHLSVADKSGNLAETEKEIVVVVEDDEHHDH
jgi:hypothetical protein